ncbi:hypothetical protein AWC38_SpisGene2034 [Stylophora pistillata]|uniref:Ubiquitin-like domain-containing protein n=1 Tax=Stylophora pistillata TaxID=50429 RepID=A0A2B4SR07_STYPI|nr:hypothetical protein AWC38_SpisGene2034 [Stylophora pistillata]
MFAVGDRLPRIVTENIDSGLKLFEALEEDVHIGPQDLALLHDGFQAIGRMDLARRIQFFPRKLHRTHETDDRQDDIVTDGVGNGSDPEQKESDLPYTGARTAAADKHAMTFRSEVVQPLLRSANAGIRSTSTSLKGGCHLDITIDGYDVGKWALKGGEEMSIERSAYEAKRFTFYRIKTAPKEAGIESGRPENGLVKSILERPGDLRLIDAEITITVTAEPSSCLPFPVKVHPGKARVYNLMEQIERELRISLRDQELYYERNFLSATPSKYLPLKLICSLRPAVSVIIPEYIHITVEYPSGDSISLKIDKEKNLRELMEEIPSFNKLQENEEVALVFNGKQLCPSKEKGTIASLGICSGSKLGLTVRILHIEVNVCFSNSLSFRLKCDPQETFQDLVEKILKGYNSDECKLTFALDGSEFDPDQDTGPLQDYGISQGCSLRVTRHFTTPRRMAKRPCYRALPTRPHLFGQQLTTGHRGLDCCDRVSIVKSDPAWRSGATTLQGLWPEMEKNIWNSPEHLFLSPLLPVSLEIDCKSPFERIGRKISKVGNFHNAEVNVLKKEIVFSKDSPVINFTAVAGGEEQQKSKVSKRKPVARLVARDVGTPCFASVGVWKMASAQDENCISPYRRLLIDMSTELSSKDLERLKYAVGDRLPKRLTENMESGLKLFEALEQDVHIGPQNLSLLHDGFKAIGRVDLAQRIQVFSRKLHEAGETEAGRDDTVSDGVGNGSDPEPKGDDLSYVGARKAAADERVETFRSEGDQSSLYSANAESTSTGPSGGNGDGPAAEHVVAVGSDDSPTVTYNTTSSESVGPSSDRLQHDSAEPAVTRYVNFLVYMGYSVEILGGKHYKTPDGEFVEMKSGTQYKIHVKNSHDYGCHLDISIDGYDVGAWALRGREEMSIERSAYEAKKFTFYRVKNAPKEAGIESGRPENGVVKCVFTPEAFLNIPVITSDSSQPLKVSMPPSATVGKLKHELQHQMGVMHDQHQVLAKGDKVLRNGTRLRGILETPGDLRLIDAEVAITVTAEPSSSLPFTIRVHPGKATVHNLMERIEVLLEIPIRDQKLYHEGNLLSKAPSRCLPDKLICSPRPAVSVIFPEYIYITVEDQSGDLIPLKTNVENNLRAVMEQIPSCGNLQENEEAAFVFNGKQLCPSKDKGTIASLGICSGSKLGLTVRILHIEVKVCLSDNSRSFRLKCDPQETFQDLVEKILLKGHNSSKCRLTFTMGGRKFDPGQDKGPLEDYGVTHGCTLWVTRQPTTAPDHSTSDKDLLLLQGKQITETSWDRRGVYSSLRYFLWRWTRQTPPKRAKSVVIAGWGQHFPQVVLNHSAKNTPRRQSRRLQRNLKYLRRMERLLVMKQQHFPAPKTGFRGKVLHGNEEASYGVDVIERDPAWRSGGTTLQCHSTQQFITAEPIKVDHSKKVELVLRLVARDGEEDLVFPKGCHLDISIDGYDVGGWELRGREEMSIERSAYEAKKFTFYRVKTAPKEAGIESGRPENGVVKCVFTPEAFLNIPMITSDSSQPLNVSLPPSATVGELKRELQRQMGVMHDHHQVLAKGDKVLSNEDQSGDLIPLKIDKEKNLRAVLEQIPSCGKLQENEEATFVFNGKQLCPSKDKGTIASLGICSGSKLGLTVRILHIEVKVCLSDNSRSFRLKCDPQETFQDLMEKILLEGHNSSKCRLTFTMGGREFDPDQDKGPLEGNQVSREPRGIGREVFCNDLSSSETESINRFCMTGRFVWFIKLVRLLLEEAEVNGVSQAPILGFAIDEDPLREFKMGVVLNEGTCSFDVIERDPAWRSGGTTLQGHSTQQFTMAEPIKVDHSRKVELVLRLVARDGEEDLVFPKGECKPLSTLTPPPVQE